MGTTEQIPSTLDTYSAIIRNFTPAATPTDIVTIAGAATKIIKILKIELWTTQTTAGVNEFLLIKRSALDTGGTPVSMPAVPLDSRSPAAVATVSNWTANPAGLGTAVGTIEVARPAANVTTGSTNPSYVFDFMTATNGSPIVLRSAVEQLALNFNGAAVPAGYVSNINVRWIEMPANYGA